MAQRKKIVATDMDLPKDMTREVSVASGSAFVVKKTRDLKPDNKKDVRALFLAHSGPTINSALFQEFPNVEMIQCMSAGVDFVDFASIPENVKLCSNAGAYKEPMAEHVFGMFLYFAKNLARNNERMRNGTFDNTPDGIFLSGKTLGIIGAGGIGQSVARIAKAMNMKTIGINTTGRPVPDFDVVWPPAKLDKLLKESDFVLLSLPLNVHTQSLIGAKRLKLMKDNAVVVNVARGAIVSQADLYAHLKAHPNFKYGNDVWWRYPKKGEKWSPDLPFFELPNFIGSPHNSEAVPEAHDLGQRNALQNILRFVSGEPVQWVVDKSNYKGFSRIPRP
jgi:phosphoglycerate dehydrogenase-like enzyme